MKLINRSIVEKTSTTPLHNAAKNGDSDIVKALIDDGTDIEQHDTNGRTPIQLAARHKQLDIINLLVDSGANINAKDNDGNTPLHKAISRGQLDLSSFLLEQGADVNAVDNDGYTPICLAALCRQADILVLLIENGADIKASDKYGSTLLHASARNNQHNIAKILIEHGANINTEDKSGYTALQYAEMVRYNKVANLIQDHKRKIATFIKDVQQLLNNGLRAVDFFDKYRESLRGAREDQFSISEIFRIAKRITNNKTVSFDLSSEPDKHNRLKNTLLNALMSDSLAPYWELYNYLLYLQPRKNNICEEIVMHAIEDGYSNIISCHYNSLPKSLTKNITTPTILALRSETKPTLRLCIEKHSMRLSKDNNREPLSLQDLNLKALIFSWNANNLRDVLLCDEGGRYCSPPVCYSKG